MTSVNQKVWNIISKELCVQRELLNGLINVRALAKYLIDKYGLTTSLDSVISAIRRYESSGMCEITDEKVVNLFKDCVITTRSNVVCVTIPKSTGTKILDVLNHDFKNTYVISGTTDFKVISDFSEIAKIKKVFPNGEINIETGLGVLGVVLSPEATQTKGVLAKIASEISIYGVNITEMIICPPEFLILVKDEDMLKTHEAIMNIKLGKI